MYTGTMRKYNHNIKTVNNQTREAKQVKREKEALKKSNETCMHVFLVLYNHYHYESTNIIVRCYFFSDMMMIEKKKTH